MSRIKAVIFDWAGTTVDYGCFAPVQAFTEVFKHFGITPTVDEVRAPMGLLKRDHIKSMLNMERIHGLWLEKYSREFTEQDIDDMYSLFECKLFSILHNFAAPKPYVLESIAKLREMGIQIGSTTGYTDRMMDIVAPAAKVAGYAPDVCFSPDSVEHIGRPYPFMIFKNMQALKIQSVAQVLKVGDTVSDIKEGKNAGVLTVGVLEGSSEMGLSQAEYESLCKPERTAALEKTANKFHAAGADFVIHNMSDLIPLVISLG